MILPGLAPAVLAGKKKGPPVFLAARNAIAGAGSTLLSVPRPDNVAAGDFLVVFGAKYYSAVATAPSGWSTLVNSVYDYNSTFMATKVAGATEPGVYTWTFDNPSITAMTIVAYRNVTGIDVRGPLARGYSVNSLTVPSITATTAGILLSLVSVGSTSLSAGPAGMIQRQSAQNGSIGVASYDLDPSAAGATGAKVVSLSGNGFPAGMLMQIS